ncbi:hypothetical protein G6F40_016591 [Rhizopus arrhizus]|nr:hypothetical protein G6F40_016591 [Rhizopus arrhizus]
MGCAAGIAQSRTGGDRQGGADVEHGAARSHLRLLRRRATGSAARGRAAAGAGRAPSTGMGPGRAATRGPHGASLSKHRRLGAARAARGKLGSLGLDRSETWRRLSHLARRTWRRPRVLPLSPGRGDT